MTSLSRSVPLVCSCFFDGTIDERNLKLQEEGNKKCLSDRIDIILNYSYFSSPFFVLVCQTPSVKSRIFDADKRGKMTQKERS